MNCGFIRIRILLEFLSCFILRFGLLADLV